MVEAQLVERSLPKIVIGKIKLNVYCIEKSKIKEKEIGNGSFKKTRPGRSIFIKNIKPKKLLINNRVSLPRH